MNFYEPILARCYDRSNIAKVNPVIGEPQQYINNNLLRQLGLVGISFDFFIDWKNLLFNREVWIKLPYHGTRLPNTELISLLKNQDRFVNLVKFSKHNNLSVSAIIFDDYQDWSNSQSFVTNAYWPSDHINKNGLLLNDISINEIKHRIIKMSGGEIKIGKKGLIYGTSRLECYLSHTDALWPGDVDLLIYSSRDFSPLAIIEYKKHTNNSKIPFDNQNIKNYYPYPDQRKYDRLIYLSNQLTSRPIPIYIFYYSTNSEETYLLVESFFINEGRVISNNITKFNIDTANVNGSYIEIIRSLITQDT